MKKIITFIMSLVGLLFISSCGNEETYSLKDISKSEVSNISTIMASTSAFQSASWPLSDTSYSYLDTKYIKTDFNIEEEFMKYPPKEDQDDAYIMRVDFNDSATHIFYISHKTNYMYYKGIEFTYRSLDIVPKELIDIINDKPKINTFDATIISCPRFLRALHNSRTCVSAPPISIPISVIKIFIINHHKLYFLLYLLHLNISLRYIYRRRILIHKFRQLNKPGQFLCR